MAVSVRGRGRGRPTAGGLRAVLVATDFSASADRALRRAARLPLAPGAVLTVLHVAAGGPGDARGRSGAGARRALERARALVAGTAREQGVTRHEVVARQVQGTPFVEIVRAARRARAELVVLGRHGQRTFRELVLGSTAERTVRAGDTPTLVVSAAPTRPYRRPLVAVDGSAASRRALELAVRLVGPRAAGLAVVRAYGVPFETAVRRTGASDADVRRHRRDVRRDVRATVEAFLATCGEAGRDARLLVARGDARGVVIDAAARYQPDLLALGTHARSGVAYVLLGSVAEAVLRSAACDVLIARPPELAFTLP
jgi:nucleotide-binding universal stress UspA family protein